MKLKRLVYQVLAITLILSLTLGCNLFSSLSLVPQSTVGESQGSESRGSFQLQVPTNLDPSPEAAAAALLDPNRVEEGVWFLLRGLGIGVYTGDGQQILAGSETGPQDFWLYDFEFPLMVRMAQEPSRPFSEFLPVLTELGWKPDLEQTLKQYKEGYAANPNAYMVRLFAATGLLFEGDPQITPLQEWLLLLDTFLPPNPTANTGMGAPSWVGLAAAGFLPLLEQTISGTGIFSSPEQQSCGSIRGGSFIPNWGVANGFLATVNDLIEVGRAYYAIHGPLLARSIKAELRPSKWLAHEGHGALGDSITFTLTLRIDYGGLNMTFMPPTCGLLVNNIINMDAPLVSPLRDVQVWWRLSDFRDHGSFQDFRSRPFDGSRPTQTDPSGQTAITFQARQEPANGQGELKTIKANIEANYDPRLAIQMMGVTEPRLLMFLYGLIRIRLPENISLEWHAQAAYKVDGPFGESRIYGEICSLDVPFTLNWDSGVGLAGTVTFTPTSNTGGTWSLEGAMASVGVTNAGAGSYIIQGSTENNRTALVLNGSGSQTTAGVVTANFPVNNQVIELAPSQCSQP
jgi:hypothetical protein